MFCFSGPNLVILARTGDELSCGQASDWHTHTQTQATTIPGGQNWPRVKTYLTPALAQCHWHWWDAILAVLTFCWHSRCASVMSRHYWTILVCWGPGLSVTRSRPNWITGPGPKSGSDGKSESRGPENGVSRWRRSNSDIYSQNHHFGLVYDMIYQFLGMEAKNYKFGMFCQQCHPSVASDDAEIRPRYASQIHTSHLFMS